MLFFVFFLEHSLTLLPVVSFQKIANYSPHHLQVHSTRCPSQIRRSTLHIFFVFYKKSVIFGIPGCFWCLCIVLKGFSVKNIFWLKKSHRKCNILLLFQRLSTKNSGCPNDFSLLLKLASWKPI